jgi:hypothetical protein
MLFRSLLAVAAGVIWIVGVAPASVVVMMLFLSPPGCHAPELQLPLVAPPRNQLFLDHEVAGIWRPLRLSERTPHPSQIALQRDLQLTAAESLTLQDIDQ